MGLDHVHALSALIGSIADLRQLQPTDIPWIRRFAGDARVACMTRSIPHPLPTGAAEDFFERAQSPHRTEEVWAIDARRAGGAPLAGIISLKAIDRGQSEIGYWVAPDYWGAGLASDAVRTLMVYNPMRNCTIFGSVYQDNPASARVLTNNGFEYIGDAEVYSIARNAAVPTWTYLKRFD